MFLMVLTIMSWFKRKPKELIDWSKRPIKRFEIYLGGMDDPIIVRGHEYTLAENTYQTQIDNWEAPGNCRVYRGGEIVARFRAVVGVVEKEP